LSEYLRSCQLQSRTAARTKCDTHGGEGFSLIGVDLFFLECYSWSRNYTFQSNQGVTMSFFRQGDINAGSRTAFQ
jgi:hypothetical protein